MKIISCENISFSYTQNDEKDILVFSDLSLCVSKGEFIAVLGHNGSGKSTLAKHFNAILLPSSGVVSILGMNTAEEEHTLTIRSHVGMVFQNPDNQLVATIVEEDVAFALENLGVESKEIRRRVDEALKTVDMYEHRMHAPHQLSGGQKQRVAIAGVLAMEPDCIVLDEPTAMLDPKGRGEVMETLKSLSDRGITVVLITHYMNEAAQADRVVVMDQGYIMEDGTPHEVFAKVERLKEMQLDVPQSSELMYGLQQEKISFDKIEINIDDCVSAVAAKLDSMGVKKIYD